MWIEAPDIALKFIPGQFVIVRVDDRSERIPLTIVDVVPETGALMLLVQVVGRSTLEMSRLKAGDTFLDVVGPLGLGMELAKHHGKVVCVGGGIGTAPLYPKAKALKNLGNYIISVIGARTKDLLVLEDEMRAISDEFVVCTDDGSYGQKALVTGPLAEVLAQNSDIAEIIAIGPPIMMKFVCRTTAPTGIKTLVSLNPIMIDGTGMCGGCRVSYNGNVKFACVDGPVFDGAAIDWAELLARLQTYTPQEKIAMDHYCKVSNL
jgi:ferredoxin--NADP+ reductase